MVLKETSSLKRKSIFYCSSTQITLLQKQVLFLRLAIRRRKNKQVTSSTNLSSSMKVVVAFLLLVEQQKQLLLLKVEQDYLLYPLPQHSSVILTDSAGSGLVLVIYQLLVVLLNLERMITVMNFYNPSLRLITVSSLLQQQLLMITAISSYQLLQAKKTTAVFSTPSSLLLKEPTQSVVQPLLLRDLLTLVLVHSLLLVEQQKLLLKQTIPLDSSQSVVSRTQSDPAHTSELEHSTHSVALQNLELGYTTEIFLLYLHLKITVLSMLLLHPTKIKVRYPTH